VKGLAKRALLAAWGATSVGCVPAATQEAPSAAPAAAPRRPPNVVVVVIDTLRRDRLGCYGGTRGLSPHLDALAAEATVFERCLAPSSWTEPSTASLLTGLYPTRHGCHEYAVLPPELELLSERFGAAGYRTVGVSGNPNASPQFAFDQGFDAFWFDASDHARDYPDVSELVGHAEALLAQDDGRPTFLYLHVMNVHGPYLSPDAWRDRFRRSGAVDFPFQNDVWRAVMRDGALERRKEVTPERLLDLASRYDAAVAWTDDVVGRFLERRRATVAGADEIVLVTADHGEELFDHGGFGHGFTLQHEVVDVPLLLRLPTGRVAAQRRIDVPVSLVDVPATLLDLAGLLPADAAGAVGDGRSLAPLLQGKEFERDAPLISHLERGKQGSAFLLQSGSLRLIETRFDYAGRRDVAELFELVADPREQHDLLAADPDRAARLRALLAWRRQRLEEQGLATEPLEMTAEQKAQMEALGYSVGGAAPSGGR